MALFDSNLTINQGSRFSKSFTWKVAGAPVNLTGYTAKSQIRLTPESPDPIHEMSTENGGIVISPMEGKVQLSIPASATESFNFNKSTAVFDVELYNSNNDDDIISLVGGLVKLNLQVTR